jgi:hypothetical protein
VSKLLLHPGACWSEEGKGNPFGGEETEGSAIPPEEMVLNHKRLRYHDSKIKSSISCYRNGALWVSVLTVVFCHQHAFGLSKSDPHTILMTSMSKMC